MCGIAGMFNSSGTGEERNALERALESLRMRGPDDGGIWIDGGISLGHRRLAIVDPSPAGHQPMLSADGRYVASYNGEIYNHAELRPLLEPPGGWRGGSDTETLLEAFRQWGPRCLERFNGMFAFAIWDRLERRLFLARDRVGEKPLYYGSIGGRFAFASRPAALQHLLGAAAMSLDTDAVRAYLELGYVPAPLSLHSGLRKLPPAHCAFVDAAGLRIVRWWDYRHIEPDSRLASRRDEDLADELEELLQRAVSLRLMADVPLGALLSGGVDSATVVALMRRAGSQRPKAFTIGFDEPRHDESRAAARIASILGADHAIERLSVDGLVALLPDYVRSFDEPLADHAVFPTLAVARLARQQVTVALSGDGGDELFGGYHHYDLVRRLQSVKDVRGPARALLTMLASAVPGHRGKLLVAALAQRDTVSMFHFLRGIGKDFGPLLQPAALDSSRPSIDLFAVNAASHAMDLDAAETGMRLDLGLLLPESYLQKLDVSTMAWSLEGRCPFTDYRLVEWAMRLPMHFKLRRGTSKFLLKRVLQRHLPRSVVHQPKRGFVAPVADWLRGPLRDWSRELLADDTLLAALPLDAGRVRDLFELNYTGRREAHTLVWGVLMLLCHVAEHVQARSLPVVRPHRIAA